MIRPDGVRITRAYTEDGVLASITDREGRTWRYAFGAFDVLQSIQAPGSGKLSFAYDCEGRVVAVTNKVGVAYHLIRDAAGRVIAEEDFDGRRTEYARDPGRGWRTSGYVDNPATSVDTLGLNASAGSIRNVNQVGGTQNCVNCAIATDATLGGRPASAQNGCPTILSVLEKQ